VIRTNLLIRENGRLFLAALVRLPLVGTEHFIDHEQNEIYLLTSTGLLMEGANCFLIG
jgi:hypothetical protein